MELQEGADEKGHEDREAAPPVLPDQIEVDAVGIMAERPRILRHVDIVGRPVDEHIEPPAEDRAVLRDAQGYPPRHHAELGGPVHRHVLEGLHPLDPLVRGEHGEADQADGDDRDEKHAPPCLDEEHDEHHHEADDAAPRVGERHRHDGEEERHP